MKGGNNVTITKREMELMDEIQKLKEEIQKLKEEVKNANKGLRRKAGGKE